MFEDASRNKRFEDLVMEIHGRSARKLFQHAMSLDHQVEMALKALASLHASDRNLPRLLREFADVLEETLCQVSS